MTVIFPLEAKRTALLVYDVINEMADPEGAFYSPSTGEILPRIQKLMALCRDKGMPVIYTVPVNKGAEDMGRMADFYPELVSRNLSGRGAEAPGFTLPSSRKRGIPLLRNPGMAPFMGLSLRRSSAARALILFSSAVSLSQWVVAPRPARPPAATSKRLLFRMLACPGPSQTRGGVL